MLIVICWYCMCFALYCMESLVIGKLQLKCQANFVSIVIPISKDLQTQFPSRFKKLVMHNNQGDQPSFTLTNINSSYLICNMYLSLHCPTTAFKPAEHVSISCWRSLKVLLLSSPFWLTDWILIWFIPALSATQHKDTAGEKISTCQWSPVFLFLVAVFETAL